MADKVSKIEMEQAQDMARYVMEQPIQQESDLTGVMKIMNEDKLEADTGLPSIDMRTRLQPIELSSMIIHDTVVALGCLPKVCLITTRTKKRLAVSLQGRGREELVEMVQSERKVRTGGGVWDKVSSLFTGSQQ
jgi:hypothetical protein